MPDGVQSVDDAATMTRRQLSIAVGALLLLAALLVFVVPTSEDDDGSPSLAGAPTQFAQTPRPSDLVDATAHEDARSQIEPQAPQPASTHANSYSPAQATIRGIVVLVTEGHERPFFPSEVILLNGKQQLQRLATDRGSFEFKVEPLRTYRIELVEDSLPQGVLPPWDQRTESPGSTPGFNAVKIAVPKEGGEFSPTLRVFSESIVWGFVLGPSGEPVVGVHVRLQSRIHPAGLVADAETDAYGRFEMRGTYPGKYRTEVWTSTASDAAYRAISRPVPIDVEVLEGDSLQVPTIFLGTGVKSVSGLVVNQDGSPFGELRVLCYLGREVAEGEPSHDWGSMLATAVTDKDGRYNLIGLPDERINIQLAADYEPSVPLGKRKSAFWVEPITMDLRGTSLEFIAPTRTVDESRPFFFKGRIVLNTSWASAQKREVTLKSLRVAVELQDPASVDTRLRRPSFSREAKVDRTTGEFEWACETPLPAVVLTVSSSGGESEPVRIVLFPHPFDRQEQEIPFPY